jgi:hypothetical protein
MDGQMSGLRTATTTMTVTPSQPAAPVVDKPPEPPVYSMVLKRKPKTEMKKVLVLSLLFSISSSSQCTRPPPFPNSFLMQPKKKVAVQWTDDVVDNEFSNKKKSKSMNTLLAHTFD